MSNYHEITEADLAETFRLYQRWVQEGSRPYFRDFVSNARTPEVKPQYFYDTYHDSIKDLGNGTFEFNIQTYDSPEGDTWVRGSFIVNAQTVNILEQRAYSN